MVGLWLFSGTNVLKTKNSLKKPSPIDLCRQSTKCLADGLFPKTGPRLPGILLLSCDLIAVMPTKKILTIFGSPVLFLAFLIWPLNLVYAIAVGPNNPGTNVNDSSIGTITWTNRDNDKTSNNQYATTQGMNSGMATVYLKATHFDFSLPAEAIVDGITVNVERKASDSNFFDNAIRIVKGGVIGATDLSTGEAWPTNDATISYGSGSDLWGETWTGADINSENFGFALSATKVGGETNKKPSIDWINITVSYHLPAQTPVVTWSEPLAVTYGTPLSISQLNASSLVSGDFTYTPDSGIILDVGTNILSVLFTPTDLITYATTTATTSLVVTKGEQIIDWSNPADLIFGNTLGSTELNATVTGSGSSVPGVLIYDPPLGTELALGFHTLAVTALATDNYNSASQTVEINILPIPNSVPVASAVAITGTVSLGQILTGSYNYSDIDNDLEGVSTFRWLRNDVVIEGETASTYTLRTIDFGTTIKFEVTPLAVTGATSGSPVQSVGTVVIREVAVLTPTPTLDSTRHGPTGFVRLNNPPIQAKVLGVKIYNWKKNLSLGSRGEDVKILQQTLIKYQTGPKVKKLEQTGATGYFGSLTKAVLAEYQRKVGISPAVGYFGPITRAYLGKLTK